MTSSRLLDPYKMKLPHQLQSAAGVPQTQVPPLERLTTTAKFFTHTVSPFPDIGDAMLYGPEHHWSPPVVSCPSNSITIHSSELEQQQIHIKAFKKILSTVPDLLDVIKHVYLEIPTKSKQWKLLVKAMQTAARSARTVDTNGLKHQLTYALPNPTKDVLAPPVLKQESKSDRGVTHPVLRYLILPWWNVTDGNRTRRATC
ncbi:hypothetical protein B0H17DRAFT_1206850 [Mycena rosella]|uniref:Uncharacterized protein n=1 Tax=Mycena rosella TaxID=1033263 RepID=A0AAD7GB67_MYCRO|nr:hypothetical protein B0H17DRAFT_1206850 [Mycena rosella]